MSSKAIAIIQARMSSSRLPGKVLKPLAGKPMIWHIHNRVKHCTYLDKVVVATSTDHSDDVLFEYCKSSNIEVHRGSLENVLKRFLDILKNFEYPYFVRITGDCPLIDASMIDLQLEALKEYNADITWCSNPGTALEGAGAQSTRSLLYINENTKDPDDLEHVGSVFIAKHPDKFKVVEYYPPEELIVDGFRLTVDEEADYKLMSEVYDNLWQSEPLNLVDVLNFLRENPKLIELNNGIKHKYLNNMIKDKKNIWIAKHKFELLNNTYFEYQPRK